MGKQRGLNVNRRKAASLRVANIIEEGRIGGPQRRMVLVANALQGRVDTTLVFPRQNSLAFQKLCREHQVVYETLPLTRITKEWRVAIRYLFGSVFEVLRLAKYLRSQTFDLVHVSGGSWQYKGIIAAHLAGVPVVWHMNDTYVPRLFYKLCLFVSRLASGFIFASEASRAYYAELLGRDRPDSVIPAPADCEKFRRNADFDLTPHDAEYSKEWVGETVIGTVANVSPVKDLATFVRMASELNNRYSRLRFVVVGPISDSQTAYGREIETLVHSLGVSNITFVGQREDVRPLLAEFDIFVCSSRAESSPLSVWEAMAMSLPIVSTQVGDVPKYVREGQEGFLAPVEDALGLAEGVSKLISDAALRCSIGAAAREAALANFPVARIAELTEAAYRSVLDGAR